MCSVETRLHRIDRVLDELGALGAFGSDAQELRRRADGDIRCRRANILHRLLLSSADLLLGLPGAPLQRLGKLGACLMRIGFRFPRASATMSSASFSAWMRLFLYSSRSACASSRSLLACASSLAMPG